MKRTKLSELEEKQKCRVIDINLEGETKYRLLDMGIIPNTEIEITKKAPLGDPIQIFLRGYSISIRKEIARKIEVEVEK